MARTWLLFTIEFSDFFLCFCCNDPQGFRLQGAYSDFSGHNWDTIWCYFCRCKIQVKEERRIWWQTIDICFSSPFLFLLPVYLNIFLHYSFAIGVLPEYMCGTSNICVTTLMWFYGFNNLVYLSVAHIAAEVAVLQVFGFG